EANAGGLLAEDIQAHERTNYPVTLIVLPGKALELRLLHDRSRLDDAAATRLLDHLRTILERLPGSATRTLSTLAALPAAETALLASWNATAAHLGAPACVHELIEAQARRTPDALAGVSETATPSAAALDGGATRLAYRLRQAGAGPGLPVGLLMERPPELVAGVLAILRGGGVSLPLDPALPADRLAFMLADARPCVVLAQP